MCIFCFEGDIPFHLRKSAAFPGKMIAEVPEVDSAEAQPRSAAAFSCDSPEPAIPTCVWPQRKTTPSTS